MLATLFAHLRRQWMGALALMIALGTGSAYAANTVFSADIVDGEVKAVDIAQGAVATSEIANNQVKAADIGDGEVRTADIGNGQVKTADIGTGEVRSANVLTDNLTGGDIAPNSLKGADIDESTLSSIGGGGPAGGDLAGTYPNPQIRSNALGGGEVIDGSLNDEDVGQLAVVNFAASIGTLGGNVCQSAPISGINAQGDHLLLTPSDADSEVFLDYSIKYRPASQDATLITCNRTEFPIDDGTTHFDLLVFDAQ